MSFLSDGKFRGSAIREDSKSVEIRTIDQAQEEKQELHFDCEVEEFFLSDNGRYGISVQTDRQLTLWDLDRAAKIVSMNTPAPVNAVAFSPVDPDCFAIACKAAEMDDSEVLVRVADRAEFQRLPRETTKGLYAIAYSPAGDILAAAGFTGKIQLWDVCTGQALRSMENGETVVSLCFSRDGSYLATGSHQLKLWHVHSGRVMLPLGPQSDHGKFYEAIAFSPDGRMLVAATDRRDRCELHIFLTK